MTNHHDKLREIGTKHELLRGKIRALFAKTVENGATEAEEMAAAEKARALIDQYQIDMGEEALKEEGFVQKDIKLDAVQFSFARNITFAVEQFCEVMTWYHVHKRTSAKITVLGLASDAEFASWLIESLTAFAVSGADVHVAIERKVAFALGETPDSKELRRSYLHGCAVRINQRLEELTEQRKQRAATPSGSTALVKLDKADLIKAEMQRLDIHLHACSYSPGGGDSDSFAAGSERGSKASFGRPVGGRGGVAGLIGRSK